MTARAFCAHNLEPLDLANGIDARLHTKRVGNGTSVSYLAYGGDVLIEPEERTYFAVLLPLAGECRIEYAGEQVRTHPGAAAVLPPDRSLVMNWSADCAHLVYRIERVALEAHLGKLLGSTLHQPLRFAPTMPLDAGPGRSWAAGFRTLVTLLDQPDSMIEHPLAAAEFESGLLTGLLLAQPHPFQHQLLDRNTRPAPSRPVRLAVDIMQNHPEWEHTTGSLARVTGVGVRTLQRGFREQLGVTPREYLNDVRLQRVRDELRAHRPEHATVGEIASRWGFPHPGRFSVIYRQRFGESPSATLRE
ncbi:AraC family transcriptional regulator [Amycolatopsis granulosa]|uniref:AraC family transcriptional regulator n=1 Tax=Amycolatopsis granulosa TaxID=185684 RepID=UPI001423A8EB|nr:AraC family transcriptional regulator [Amycolatopsis granulosa]NIH85761.1 AraC-like DNA-binding protein [Amycolatopsis granulosa]